mgnify:CR=1 FL=1
MTKEEVDKLFEQSFFEFKDENSFTCMSFSRYKFAELVAQHERDECLKICETYADIDTTPSGVCDNYHAYLIRERSKQ